MILGTDLSAYTRNVNYQAMRDYGVYFGINKLGQNKFIDPLYIVHKNGCNSVGVYESGYWFGDYRYSAGPQAEAHVAAMNGQYGWGQLGQWVDLEYEDRLGWGHPSGANMHSWLVAYRNRYKILAPGKCLGLYTNPELIHSMRPYLTPDDLAMPLWIANWETNNPDYEPWPRYDFHQKYGDVPAEWATGGVDYDYFNGTIDELREYAEGGEFLTMEDMVDILWREAKSRGWNLTPDWRL